MLAISRCHFLCRMLDFAVGENNDTWITMIEDLPKVPTFSSMMRCYKDANSPKLRAKSGLGEQSLPARNLKVAGNEKRRAVAREERYQTEIIRVAER